MHSLKLLKFLLVPVLAIGLLMALSACDEENASIASESKVRSTSYDTLVRNQPAKSMNYSSTRETINFWIDTWNKKGKLAYVYLQAANGQLIGYYVTKGLPVSYCAALTPTWQYEDTPEDGSSVKDQRVPAPSVDGVYYSGGNCNTFYARDASTGQYIEYTAGNGINPLIYESPLPRQNVEPLGFTTIEKAQSLNAPK
jgi:hypothetical protein